MLKRAYFEIAVARDKLVKVISFPGAIKEDFRDYVKPLIKPGFHYTANAATTTQKQSDYKVEQSSFTLIALF